MQNNFYTKIVLSNEDNFECAYMKKKSYANIYIEKLLNKINVINLYKHEQFLVTYGQHRIYDDEFYNFNNTFKDILVSWQCLEIKKITCIQFLKKIQLIRN